MKKLLTFLLFLLPILCLAQVTPVTPQFKRKLPADSLLGYSIPGVTGTHWMPDTAWINSHTSTIFSKQFIGSGKSIIDPFSIKDDRRTHFNHMVMLNDSGNYTHTPYMYWDSIAAKFDVVAPINFASDAYFTYQIHPSYLPAGAVGDSALTRHDGIMSIVPMSSFGFLKHAGNGLHLSGDTAQLGGTVTSNTTVDLNNRYLKFDDVTKQTVFFDLQPSATSPQVFIQAADSTSGNGGTIILQKTGAQLFWQDPTTNNIQGIFANGTIQIQDSYGSIGIQNAADYSTNIKLHPFALVQTNMLNARADSIVALIPTTVQAANGNKKVGDTVIWGGGINRNTNIHMAASTQLIVGDTINGNGLYIQRGSHASIDVALYGSREDSTKYAGIEATNGGSTNIFTTGIGKYMEVQIPNPDTSGHISIPTILVKNDWGTSISSAADYSNYEVKHDSSYTTKKAVVRLIDSLASGSITGFVPASRTLTAGFGIKTIGDLSVNRTIAADTAFLRTIYASATRNVVTDFGADNTGVSVANTAIQNALNLGGNIYFPKGTYLINCNSPLKVKSNTTIIAAVDAVFQAQGNSNPNTYSILKIDSVSNVVVKGGQFIGERSTHIGTPGTHGHGIAIYSSTNVKISDVAVSNCVGDGFYIGKDTLVSTLGCSNIHVDRVTSTNNRRNGLTISIGQGIWITNSSFTYSNGTTPQVGIDIEPNSSTDTARNIYISKNTFANNTTNGLLLYGANGYTSEIFADNNKIENNEQEGLRVYKVVNSGFTNNHITGNGAQTNNTYAAISVETSATGNTFSGNIIRAGSYANKIKYGINLLSTTASNTVQNNDLNSGAVSGAYADAGTGNQVQWNLGVTTTLPNANLVNSTISGISLGSNLANLTAGRGIILPNYNGGTTQAVTLDTTKTMTWLKPQVIQTTTANQSSVNYDGTHGMTISVNSAGATTFNTTTSFIFTPNVAFNGSVTYGSTNSNLYNPQAAAGQQTAVSQYQYFGATSSYLRVGSYGNTAATPAAGATYAGLFVASAPVTSINTGTANPFISGAVFMSPTVTNGGVQPTNVASAYFGPASTIGASNYTAYFDIGAIGIKEGSNGRVGQTTLVSGTKAITITGVTTASRAIVTLVSQGGTVTTTVAYAAVCTSNTLTITALTNAGTTDTTDTSILNYFIVN